MLRNKKLLLVTFGFSFLLTAAQSVQQYITVMFDARGQLEGGYMVLFFLYAAFSLGCIVSPVFVRLYGATMCFFVSSIIYVLFTATAATEQVLFIYVTSTLIGLAASILWAAHFVYMGDISNDENRGKNAGFFWAIFSALTGAGLVATGPLIEAYSFQPVFLGLSVFGVMGTICFFFLLEKREPLIGVHNILSDLPLFRSKTTFTLSLTIFATWLLYGLMVSVVPLEIEHMMGLDFVGSISALFFVIPALASYVFGALADRLGRVRTISVGFLLSIMGVICLYIADTGGLLITGIVIATIAFALLTPVMTSLPYDIAPKGLEIRISGTFNAMSTFGITIGIFAPFVLQGKDGYLLVGAMFVVIFVLVSKLLGLSTEQLKKQVEKECQSFKTALEEI